MKKIFFLICFLLLSVATFSQVADEYIYLEIADGDTATSSTSRIERMVSFIAGAGMEGSTAHLYSAIDPDSTFYPIYYDGSIYEVEFVPGVEVSLPPYIVHALKKFIIIDTNTAQTGNNVFRIGYGTYN